MFFKIQKFPENLRADFLKLFIQVFLSHISALPNTNLYSPFSIFSSVSWLSPTATADTYAYVGKFLNLLFYYSIQRANNDNVKIFPAVHQLEDSRI